MMFPLMTLDDETEITYSELLADGRVKVYVEKADEVNKYINIIRNAHILKKYDRDFIQGGIGNV